MPQLHKRCYNIETFININLSASLDKYRSCRKETCMRHYIDLQLQPIYITFLARSIDIINMYIKII